MCTYNNCVLPKDMTAVPKYININVDAHLMDADVTGVAEDHLIAILALRLQHKGNTVQHMATGHCDLDNVTAA